ncbi:Hypothetical predicted protein, partial [Marmota monax]
MSHWSEWTEWPSLGCPRGCWEAGEEQLDELSPQGSQGKWVLGVCCAHLRVSVLLFWRQAGTNGYMAPEILMDKASYSYPVDWFAMGCSIYEMVAGRTPFKDFKEK